MAADIRSGSNNSWPHDLIVYNDKLHFIAYDDNNRQLWSYDGTTVIKLTDIDWVEEGDPYELTVYNGKLYFIGDDGIYGYELWVYNG